MAAIDEIINPDDPLWKPVDPLETEMTLLCFCYQFPRAAKLVLCEQDLHSGFFQIDACQAIASHLEVFAKGDEPVSRERLRAGLIENGMSAEKADASIREMLDHKISDLRRSQQQQLLKRSIGYLSLQQDAYEAELDGCDSGDEEKDSQGE